MDKGKRTKYNKMLIYKQLHRNVKIEQHEWTPPAKVGVNADARKALAVPAPILTSVMLLLNNTNIIDTSLVNNINIIYNE